MKTLHARIFALCRLLAAASLILLAPARLLDAAPFARNVTFTQPDGTVIQLWAKGDDFYAVFETLDGYTVIFDPASKTYFYARLTADGRNLESSGLRVGAGDPQTLNLSKHLRLSTNALRAQVAERRAAWDAEMEVSRRWELLKAAARATSDGTAYSPPGSTTTGLKVGVCLLVDFSDAPGTNSPQTSQSEIINFCNSSTYNGFGNRGSVKQYFLDNSNGKLTYTNIVTIYLRVPLPKTTYDDTSKSCGTQGRILINDALTVLKGLPNYTTEILPLFNALTVDSQNRAVACNVFFAGADSGVWSMGLWPHSGSLSSAVELWPGGKKIYRYQITNIGTQLEIGTFCHENGHMLCGYPDIYDYDYDSTGGAGYFCLMNSGNSSGGGKNPSQICAYLKRASGWMTTLDLTSTSNLVAMVTATPGTNFNRVYRYAKPGTATEYYLIENRYRNNRDANLPASGIAVWHIDELGDRDNQSMVPNTTHANYEVTLVQADNLWHFENDKNNGDANDLYYLGNTAAAYSNQLTDSSTPDCHWWNGNSSGLVLRAFPAAAATMRFVVGSNDPPPTITSQPASLTVYQASPASFSITADGIPPVTYQWQKDGSAISGATASSYTIANAQLSDAANYAAVVTHSYGSITSSAASLTVLATVSLPFALNNSNFTWTTDATYPWHGLTNYSHDGEAAAESGPISDGQTTALRATVNGPGTLSFWWTVSSQAGADKLTFSSTAGTTNTISGDVPWQQRSFILPNGLQTLSWTYSKDASGKAGTDHGWVDQVSFISGTPIAAWGANDFGQLQLPPSVLNAVAIAAGAYHNLLLQDSGHVLAWGNDWDGQCDVPASVTNAVAIAGGGYHSLALNADGTVTAWGADYYGQAAVPPSATNVVGIAAGAWHSLALRANGTVIAWGDDSWGQTEVPANLSGVVAIAAGGQHSLALKGDGSVVGWGDNTDSSGSYAGQAKPPLNLRQVKALAAGDFHSLAFQAGGKVQAWGDNSQGQTAVPSSLTNAQAIAAGGTHNLAIQDGFVIAWGSDLFGQCTVPTNVVNASTIAAGAYHSLALMGQAQPSQPLSNPVRNDNTFSVLVPTVRGTTYYLQSKATLNAPDWFTVAIVPGDGSARQIIDPTASGAQRFYRVWQQ